MRFRSYINNNFMQLWEGILKLINKYSTCTLVCIFGSVLYSQLMTHQLVNAYDGLWEYTYHSAGKWELSLGRWFWLYLDKIRFGINNDPWTSILTNFVILIRHVFNIGYILPGGQESFSYNIRSFYQQYSGMRFIILPIYVSSFRFCVFIERTCSMGSHKNG